MQNITNVFEGKFDRLYNSVSYNVITSHGDAKRMNWEGELHNIYHVKFLSRFSLKKYLIIIFSHSLPGDQFGHGEHLCGVNIIYIWPVIFTCLFVFFHPKILGKVPISNIKKYIDDT